MVPGGGKLTAPVCSSWVFMSRGSTARSAGFPLGKECKLCEEANTMVSRVCILLLLCAARQIWFVLEQPCNSLLEHHPRFQDLMMLLKIYRKHVAMKDYGGGSMKSTWLYSGISVKHVDSGFFASCFLRRCRPSSEHKWGLVSAVLECFCQPFSSNLEAVSGQKGPSPENRISNTCHYITTSCNPGTMR